MSTRVRPPVKPSRLESFARTRRTGHLLDSPSFSPTWPTPSSSPCTLVLPCTMWTVMTPSGLLGSLGSDLLASTLHRLGPSVWTFRFTEPIRVYPSPRSFSMNLSHNLHLSPMTGMSHSTPAHHEPRDTSNPHDVINHPSYKGDHHWSSDLVWQRNWKWSMIMNTKLYLICWNLFYMQLI